MFYRRFILLVIFTLSITIAGAQGQGDQDWEEYIDWAWQGEFRPYLEVVYGYTEPMHQKFSSELQKIGSYELKLGYSDISEYKKFAVAMDERYLFGSLFNEKYNYIDNEQSGATIEALRFGFGNRLGFGYNLGVIDLIPYNQIQYVWTQIDPTDTTGLPEPGQNILNRYTGTYRFGHSGEAGVKLQLIESLSVTAAYEFAVVYPRHIFWEWLGSHLIQSTALGMVSVFSEDIVNASPLLGPLMYFILKNAVAYAMYQGYQEKMNWPFDSETPITLETIRIGASITF